jgi:hypothetical protein
MAQTELTKEKLVNLLGQCGISHVTPIETDRGLKLPLRVDNPKLNPLAKFLGRHDSKVVVARVKDLNFVRIEFENEVLRGHFKEMFLKK